MIEDRGELFNILEGSRMPLDVQMCAEELPALNKGQLVQQFWLHKFMMRKGYVHSLKEIDLDERTCAEEYLQAIMRVHELLGGIERRM